jgi:dinuclear metal center YbgI/SA1388 family protein
MMKIKELTDFLHHTAPLKFQESYDNAGLIIGNENEEIKGVLICLDAIEEVIDEAIELGCNLVIAHHPIIFRGIKKLNGYSYIERVVIKAIKNDIAIFAIHTNLDNVVVSGVNTKIAEKLNLQDTAILSPKTDTFFNGLEVGSGMIGSLKEPMKPLSFLSYLKEKMELSIIKHTELCKQDIHKVAICGGSGSFLLIEAKNQKADIFITADFKYHEYFDADKEIIIADIGHFESEKYTIELLYNLIINNFSTFVPHCTKVITNPIKYFQ